MEPTAKERKFWRVVAATLGLLLSVFVVANSVRAETVPSGITLLLFGSLVALGVGNAIVNPRSSPVILTEHEEARFRRRQHIVGFAFSLILGLLIMLTDLRGSALAYLFAPIVVLPFVLLLRERLMRGWRVATSFLRRKPARVGKNGVAASNHANTADRKKRAPADWLRYVSEEKV